MRGVLLIFDNRIRQADMDEGEGSVGCPGNLLKESKVRYHASEWCRLVGMSSTGVSFLNLARWQTSKVVLTCRRSGVHVCGAAGESHWEKRTTTW
jgi:hypothetical protein